MVAWTVVRWPAVRTRKQTSAAQVAVLIPARNEERNLAECLDTVVDQACVAEIVVYDDDSEDATRGIALEYARVDKRVKLVSGESLPEGWCGKTFACARLAREARSPWLLFLDADARLSTGAVSAMVASAQERSATFLSCWPRLTMVTFWEKLLMPLLHFVVFSIYPAPLGLLRRDASLGLAHGACILVFRETYEAVGGHGAVAGEIFEDTRLARLWRERGERSICLDGQFVVRVRMYEGVESIWRGFQKNFRSAFQTETAFWLFLTAHAVLFLVPFLVMSRAAWLVIGMRALMALRFRQPLWSALLHPVGECFLLALGISSWWRWFRRQGVAWKGRVYHRA